MSDTRDSEPREETSNETTRDEATRDQTPAEGDDTPSRSLLRVTLPSLAMAGGVLALEWLRVGFQNRRMFKPDAPLTDETEPNAFDLPADDQWFRAADGIKLHGWWIPHHASRATILFCHGNTGNLGYYLGVFRYLRRLGVSIFAFDYRGYGQSEGKPSELGIYLDAQAAWHHVTSALGVDPDGVLLFGHSLGGAVAIETANRHEVPAMVIQSTFTDMRSIARLLHSPAHLVARNAFRSIEKVATLSMPKLFIHGDADPKIPLTMGRALYDAAPDPKTWYTVAGGLHNDLHRAGGDDYLDVLGAFVGEHFR